jgi:hypothetical protein
VVFVDDEEVDMLNTRSAIYKIICLQTGKAFPDGGGNVEMDEAMQSAMRDVFARLKQETAKLVEQLWPAIGRVATVLERRDLDQTDLDRLIAGGKRDAPQ